MLSTIPFDYSGIPPSLGSMSSNCLQQREGYPSYMFADSLHSLSGPYGAHARPCNPAAAHQQPPPPQFNHSTTNGVSSTGRWYTYYISVFTI